MKTSQSNVTICLPSFGLSSVGNVRKRNEDSFVCNSEEGIWLVADGVGGNECGEIASKIVSEEVPKQLLSGATLSQAVATVHEKVKLAPSTGIGVAGMATTIVLAYNKNNIIDICWVGDSRAYLFSEKQLTQLTKDHTLYERFYDVDSHIDEEGSFDHFKNILTQCIGSLKLTELSPEQTSLSLGSGDKLLLCSDGLYNEVNHKQMEGIISNSLTSKDAIESLISCANSNGGADNITAILIDANEGLPVR